MTARVRAGELAELDGLLAEAVGPWQPSEKRTCVLFFGALDALRLDLLHSAPRRPTGGRPLCLFRHCRSRHVQLYTRDDLNII